VSALPSPHQQIEEHRRYLDYYYRLRRETGATSIFEPYWAGRLSILMEQQGQQLDGAITEWMQDVTLQRMLTRPGIYKRMVEEMQVCDACPLHETRKNVVTHGGSLWAQLMLVGEAPGEDEDAIGEPFVGKSGQELFDVILPKTMGYTRQHCFVANTLKCRPPGNRDPKPGELEACSHFLLKQIALVQPKCIIAVGKHATRWLTGDPVKSMKDVSGKVWWYSNLYPVVVMVHPAAYVRNRAKYKDQIFEASQIALNILQQPYDSDFWGV
jgi:DNA polymerase